MLSDDSRRLERFALSNAVDNPALPEVVRRHFHANTVSEAESDPALAQASGNMRKYALFVVEFDMEHGASQHSYNGSFNLNCVFGHQENVFTVGGFECVVAPERMSSHTGKARITSQPCEEQNPVPEACSGTEPKGYPHLQVVSSRH